MVARLALVLVAVASLAAQNQTPREGPWAKKEGHRCWRHDDQVWSGLTFHKCACKLHCNSEGEPIEDYDCQTACNAKNQCVCHADEVCEPRGRR